MYDKNISQRFQPHYPALQIIGGLSLFLGWLYFNAASAQTVQSEKNSVGLNTMCTVISSASAALSSSIFYHLILFDKTNPTSKHDINEKINSILAGCVSITAGCNNVSLLGSFWIGLVGGFLYILGVKIFSKVEIDDPLEASIVHGICGLWGVLAVGFFDKDKGLFYSLSFHQIGI